MDNAPASITPGNSRSAQFAAGVLLATSLFLIAGKALLHTLDARPATLPALRFDLNAASPAELMVLPGIGTQLAERIVQVRADKGPFQKVDDLALVPGIGPATLERVRPWLFIATHVAHVPAESGVRLKIEPPTRPGAKPKKGTQLTAPIDLNTATTVELMQLPGIGPKLSERIVSERARKPYLIVADLRRVPGIGPKTLEKLRPFVVVHSASSASP